MTGAAAVPPRAFLRAAIPDVLFALLVVAALADPLFRARNFGGRDLLPYSLPVENAIHDAWSRGRLPVWWADVSGGRPLLPNPNSGALYPARPLLGLVPFPLAARLFPALHFLLAGLGTMRLVRALGGSAEGAWVAAASYVFSGVGVSEVFFASIHPGMALLPWVAWATVRVRRPGGAIVFGLFYGLDLLAGDVFTLGLAAAAAALWLARGVPAADRGRAAGALARGLGLALLLAAPQVVASAFWIPLTRRGVVGLKLDEALTFAVSPWRLLELVVPYPFGATWALDPSQNWGRAVFRDFFATLYGGALAAIALLRLRRDPGEGARWARAVLVLALVLSVAPSLVPSAWRGLPAPLPLRYPEKFAVGVAFALAVLAGLALDRFRGARRLPRAVLGVGVALALLAAAARAFPAPAGKVAAAVVGAPAPASREAGEQIPAALAEAGLLWAATLVALEIYRSARRPAVIAAAVAALGLVPVLANRRIVRTFRQDEIFAPTPFARAVARRGGGAARVLDESRYLADSPLSALETADPGAVDFYRRRWFFYTQSLWGGATVFNTDPDVGDLSRMQSLREASAFVAASDAGPAFFATLALSHGIRFRDQPPLPGFRRFGGDARQDWDENPLARPPVRLLPAWREAQDAVSAFRDLATLRPGEVAIETGRRGSGASGGGTVRAVEATPERLRLDVTAPAPTWLFVLRGYWPYRRVAVDGADVEPLPAQLAFTAVPIPAGRHVVDWREEIPGLPAAWLGPAAFGVIALARALRRAGARPGAAA